ncbi:SDR family NAD(P)-dependent oxidoreductase [Streptomyces microflavus]|uniref:SDR family NAD(P)-dependent oxidoreductase n=1 Tax=Streptomyces microflavus TaxID=1919 RepID=UPI003332D8E1
MARTTAVRWTENDIPSQEGRVAVVTGANSGLGLQTARALAARGAHVVLAVRDLDKGRRAAAQISDRVPGARLGLQQLDLASLASVRTAAGELREAHPRIDLLINNAGVMYTPRQKRSRVVTVSSFGHRIRAGIHFDDLQFDRSYNRVAAYGQAKLANLMFTYELQRRLAAHGTTIAAAAHPGAAATELQQNLPRPLRKAADLMLPLVTQDAAMGALPTLRAATDPQVTGGQYYGPAGMGGTRGYPQVVASSGKSHDTAVQQRLWAVSEQLTDVTFPV